MSAEGRGKKHKTARTVLLIVLAVLVLAVGLLAWRFRKEIQAFTISRQYSTAELENQLADNDQTIRDVVEASSDVTVRAPTDEEREALRDGSLSQEELIGRLTDDNDPLDAPTSSSESAPETAAPEEQPAEQAPAEPSEYQKQLSALIAQVYVLREEYLAALDSMENSAKADYKALSGSQRTAARLASLVSDYLGRATRLEKECDGKMDTIIAQMETLIQANNGDMGLTDTVFNTYVNEKSLKKAWYMSRLQEKGLI